jgi:hypothetical protein
MTRGTRCCTAFSTDDDGENGSWKGAYLSVRVEYSCIATFVRSRADPQILLDFHQRQDFLLGSAAFCDSDCFISMHGSWLRISHLWKPFRHRCTCNSPTLTARPSMDGHSPEHESQGKLGSLRIGFETGSGVS